MKQSNDTMLQEEDENNLLRVINGEFHGICKYKVKTRILNKYTKSNLQPNNEYIHFNCIMQSASTWPYGKFSTEMMKTMRKRGKREHGTN